MFGNKNKFKSFDRANDILRIDKKLSTNNCVDVVIKSDVIKILNNYLEFSPDDVEINLNINPSGSINLSIECVASRMRDFFYK